MKLCQCRPGRFLGHNPVKTLVFSKSNRLITCCGFFGGFSLEELRVIFYIFLECDWEFIWSLELQPNHLSNSTGLCVTICQFSLFIGHLLLPYLMFVIGCWTRPRTIAVYIKERNVRVTMELEGVQKACFSCLHLSNVTVQWVLRWERQKRFYH
jgi:hypothetical protein